MKDIIWLFPLLFIFHDLEEIIGFIPWLQRNEQLLAKKATVILKVHKDLSTEGFALAVAEEFVVVLFVSFFAIFYHTRFLYLIWLGGFISCKLSGLGAIYQLLQPLSCVYRLAVLSFGKPPLYFISTQLNFLFSVSLAFSSLSAIYFLHFG